MPRQFGDVTLDVGDDHVATVEMHRPPANFFDVDVIRSLAAAYQAVDADADARAIVLCSEGRHFSAGIDFSQRDVAPPDREEAGALYVEAVKLFSGSTPVVAAVQGAAIGGGMGLACSADFRVGSPESRFAANFSRLGFHHGFGMSVTVPQIVGHQRAIELFYTGRRIDGETAARFGLLDLLCSADAIRDTAHGLAAEIAASAPLAVSSIRRTMRGDLPDRVREAVDRESDEQFRLRATKDFVEGIAANAERRVPSFTAS
jgi:2-(1,2-epoxy-1,2-dihydrophenyl)acetyl-CoA isomerase